MNEHPASYASDFIPGNTESAAFLRDETVDRLVATVLEIGAELWVQRRRSLRLERILVEAGLMPADAIEQSSLSPSDIEAENALRDALAERLFSPLSR